MSTGRAGLQEGAETITATVAVLGEQTRAVQAAEQLGWRALPINSPDQLAHTHADLVIAPPALAQIATDAPVLVMDAPPETIADLLRGEYRLPVA